MNLRWFPTRSTIAQVMERHGIEPVPNGGAAHCYCQMATPPGAIVREPARIFAPAGAGMGWSVSVKLVPTQKPSRQSTMKFSGRSAVVTPAAW